MSTKQDSIDLSRLKSYQVSYDNCLKLEINYEKTIRKAEILGG